MHQVSALLVVDDAIRLATAVVGLFIALTNARRSPEHRRKEDRFGD
jgi:hypothetical protein